MLGNYQYQPAVFKDGNGILSLQKSAFLTQHIISTELLGGVVVLCQNVVELKIPSLIKVKFVEQILAHNLSAITLLSDWLHIILGQARDYHDS